MIRRSFRWKIMCALIAFSVLLITTICVAVGSYYKYMEMQQYSELAYSYAKTAAKYIDGDKVIAYAENNKKNTYYEQIMDFLKHTQEQTDILYYYVFIPHEDDLVYVWDAGQAEGTRPLGYHEKYMEGGKEISFKAMKGYLDNKIQISHDATYGYIGSVYYPIYNSDGKSVALVGVDLSMPNINSSLFYFVMVIIVCVIIVTMIFSSVLYFIFRKVFINPINTLNNAAKSMVENLESDVDVDIDISTGDEVQELAESFNQMYIGVKDYIEKLASITAEKERIGAELNVAQRIQTDMLPSIFPAFPDRDEFDISATMTPAKEVGGDFYDFFFVDDNHLAMVMADVSGKGIPAALFMMISKTLLKNSAKSGLSPRGVLEQVNNQLCENNEAEMFVTVWIGILELSSGRMICANAGHEYPAIKRKDGCFELFKDKHGFVLAGIDGSKYKEYELLLEPGDSFFVYTDGVTEATNEKTELYGIERMIHALNKKKDINCKGLLETVHQDIDCFVGNAPQFDDITMLCIQLLDIHRLAVRPTKESMTEVLDFVNIIMEKAGVPLKEKRQLSIGVDEIYSNIIQYSGAARAVIECAVEKTCFNLIFKDNGRPFNPLEKESSEITLPLEERAEGGLGILMIKKIMDKVRYEYTDGYNIFHMTKKWN